MTSRVLGVALAVLLATPACANAADASDAVLAEAGSRNGREIYERFREGLADPTCEADASVRWKAHFAHAPRQLAARNDDVLPLFGYVVESLRAAHLPTEFALIPFVESGYKPGARSPQGPAGLWQMIAITARNHKVSIRPGYDGRLSPVDSTAAAVRYLKTLHGMFAGDWRLAVMAYNSGEYRVLGALKRSGQTARNAKPEALVGLSPITQAYVRKLHALSCLLEQADDREEWLHALDRRVPLLQAVTVSEATTDIATWARQNGQDATRLQRLNPAFVGGRITRADGKPARLLAAATGALSPATPVATGAVDAPVPDVPARIALAGEASVPPTPEALGNATVSATLPALSQSITETAGRRHTVVRGDSLWKIAARHGIRVADLLQLNGLHPNSVLKPGKVLLIDAGLVAGGVGQAAGTP